MPDGDVTFWTRRVFDIEDYQMMNKIGFAWSSVLLVLLFSSAQPRAEETNVGSAFEAFDGLGEAVKPSLGEIDADTGVPSVGALGYSLDPSVLAQRLGGLDLDESPSTRGAAEARIYQMVSPSVVLVLTNDGLGSGSLISSDGFVLTNWHVVEGYGTVGVIFKPKQEGGAVSTANAIVGDIVRIDQVSDLALIKLREMPPNRVPVRLGGTNDIMVGADVHAIGHPTGESWTYTRGFVSQLRNDYEWVTESGLKHKSDVVQTQTPINPGNSGGPLLSSAGTLIGVNSFKASGEALNFAVSISEVNRFLSATEDKYAEAANRPKGSSQSDCDGKPVDTFRGDDGASQVYLFDFDCDGQVDSRGTVPDDESEAAYVVSDTDGDGKIDTAIYDIDRDGNPDYTLVDSSSNGSPDMIGYFRPGDDEPYKWEEYTS